MWSNYITSVAIKIVNQGKLVTKRLLCLWFFCLCTAYLQLNC